MNFESRKPRTALLISFVIALVAVTGLGWYFLSPFFALAGLKNAAITGDTAELEWRVDFPHLRDDFKAAAMHHITENLAVFVHAGDRRRTR